VIELALIVAGCLALSATTRLSQTKLTRKSREARRSHSKDTVMSGAERPPTPQQFEIVDPHNVPVTFTDWAIDGVCIRAARLRMSRDQAVRLHEWLRTYSIRQARQARPNRLLYREIRSISPVLIRTTIR
jgi:hypothetical protein